MSFSMNRKTQSCPDQTDVLHTQSIIMSLCHLMINLSASTYTISVFTLMLRSHHCSCYSTCPNSPQEPLAFRARTTFNTKHPLNVCTCVCATTSDMFADLVSSWILTSSRPSCTRKQIFKNSHTFSCTRWRTTEIRNGRVQQGNHRYSTCHFKQLFKISD